MSSTASSTATSQCLYAFGSPYFHQLGGTTPVELLHQTDGDEINEPTTVSGFCMMSPPWNNTNHHNTSNNNNHYSSSDNNDDVVQDIQCTWTSSIFLTKKGKVYQTGTVHGKMAMIPRPVLIRLPLTVAQIAAGRHFCLAKMEGGLAVCSWGAGHFGQLGQGGKIALLQEPMVMERLLPHIIGAPIRQVSAGGWHGLAVTTTGKIWAWGSNRRHQCGILPGSTLVNSSACDTSSEASLSSTVAYPQPIHCDTAVFSKLACGRAHSVALDEETGNVYCWGSSLYGQCGQSSRKTSVPSPRKVETLAQVHLVDVAAGEFHTLGLTGGGRVFSWGAGADGQLGHGVSVTFGKPKLVGDLDFRAIMAGQEWKHHNMYSSMTGLHTSVSHGSNTDFSSSRHDTASVAAASAAAGMDEKGDALLASNSESSRVHLRRNSTNTYVPSPTQPPTKSRMYEMDESETSFTIDTLPVPPLSVDGKSVESSLWLLPRITSIHASGSYSAAISSAGHLYTWGYNDVGMLGLPKPPDSNLINIENLSPRTSSLRQLQGCSFDARHLVLLPRRVDAVADVHVTGMSAGPCHMWCWGTPRAEDEPTVIGRTLYEVQEMRRKKNLHRMRASQPPHNRPVSQIKEDVDPDDSTDNIMGSPSTPNTNNNNNTNNNSSNNNNSSSNNKNHSSSFQQDQSNSPEPAPVDSSFTSTAGMKESGSSKVIEKQNDVVVSPSNKSKQQLKAAKLDTATSVDASSPNSQKSNNNNNHHHHHNNNEVVPINTEALTPNSNAGNNDQISAMERESWRFSMGMGKMLRRFSNSKGPSLDAKERRPMSRLRGQPRPSNTTTTASTNSTIAAAATTALGIKADEEKTAAAAGGVPSSSTQSRHNNTTTTTTTRPSRSRSTPPATTRSQSQTRATPGSRYRKGRKQQQQQNNSDGSKSVAVSATADGADEPKKRRGKTKAPV